MTSLSQQEAPGATPLLPLAGVTALEWSSFVCGPFSGRLMAALGADVIKIEPPGAGDEARRWGPFRDDIPHPERSGLFLYLNLNKRGITLDPTTSDGRAILLRLVEKADVFLEDKPPSFMEKTGLNYASLSVVNPRLVMTSITPFGQTGPHRDFKGYPLQTAHAAGAGFLQPSGHMYEGYPELGPVRWGDFCAECDVAVHATNGTLAALFAQMMTGVGQQVDVSKQEAEVFPIRSQIDAYTWDGTVHRRVAARADMVARRLGVSGTMPCKDGWVTLWPLEPHMPEALAAWLGNPEWSQDERWKDSNLRMANASEFREKIKEEFKKYTMQEIYHGLQGYLVAVSPVHTSEDLFNDPHLQARQFFEYVEHPEAGTILFPNLPFRFSAANRAALRAAPILGQHNVEVYCDLLGFSRQDLVRLRQAGVI